MKEENKPNKSVRLGKLIKQILIAVIFIITIVSGLNRFSWYLNLDSYQYAGSIPRSLLPEYFSQDAKGSVEFKISDGVIYYRWSTFFSKYDVGFWPFIKTAQSNEIPETLIDNLKNAIE